MYLPDKRIEKVDGLQRRREGIHRMFRVHQDEQARETLVLSLDAIAREGARRMLAQALEAEVEAYLEAGRAERDE